MKKETVAVVGLGYVGLPVALAARKKGWDVIGIDIDERKIECINKGVAPFEDKDVSEALKSYTIEATTDPAAVSRASVVVVAVPTPVTDDYEPDLSLVSKALESLLPHLQDKQLISIESTINPGVMDTVVMPILNRRDDISLDVIHCPERVNPGDPKWNVENIPRVLGGYSKEATKRGVAFYEDILDAPIRPMASVTEAEAVKIFENTFRDINIAFVNEMAQSFDKLDIDIVHVIEGSATKPFAFLAHYPGNGVGGHCIGVDPYYMIERARQAGFDHQFLKLARQINNSMPHYAVERMKKAVASLRVEYPTVVLLGLAYKKDIDDVRESPAVEMRNILEKEDVHLRVYDPHVPDRSTVQSLDEAVKDADVVIIGTNHSEFTEVLTPQYLKEKNVKAVIDGKNTLDCEGIAQKGIPCYGIGRSYLPSDLKA